MSNGMRIPKPTEGQAVGGAGQRHRANRLKHLDLGGDPRLSWARRAAASSDYGGSWSASQAVGRPTVWPKYGDIPGAWAQAGCNVGVVTLDVSFAPDERPAVGVLVLETLGPGALFAITAGRSPDSELLFHAKPRRMGRPSRALYVEFEQPRALGDVRLWLDTDAGANTYNEIDAVALVHEPLGLEGAGATPSSRSSRSSRADGGQPMSNVYEMFWDCGFCAATKLLGKSHRSCPSCGAPQDPTRRYFPAEHEKVAVHDHVYYGRDLGCDHCHTPNSAAAKHCVGCGAPIGDGDQAVALIEWKARRAKQEARLRRRAWGRAIRGSSFLRSRGGKVLTAIGAVVLLGVVATLVTLFWTRTATTEVTGHRWSREIAIERFEATSGGSWCDSMPSDAYGVSRSTKQSGTNEIPDGQECSTVNVDNGDGTYRQETQCQTRYRSEPVYDDWCDYTVDRWVRQYDAVAEGTGRSPSPYWPSTSTSGCASLGCTREGGRSAEYVVLYAEVGAGQGEPLECDFGQGRWSKIEVGTRWHAEIRVITGGVVCDSLELAPAP